MAKLERTWANSYTVVEAERGTYRAAYRPQQRDPDPWSEHVLVAGPGDEVRAVATPSLGGFALAVEDGHLVIYYLELPAQVERRKETGIACGQRVGATTTGGVGPLGPAGAPGADGQDGADGTDGKDATVTEEQLRAIVERVVAGVVEHVVGRVVEGVVKYPAEAGHFGIPLPEAQSGLYWQDAITVLLMNQAVQQLIERGRDEAIRNLKVGGFVPTS